LDTANTLLRQWTDKDKQTMRDQLDAMHARFVEIVRAGRVKAGAMTEAQLEQVTTGKSYLAEEAVTNRLVDEIGYLEDAIAEARTRAQITVAEPTVLEYGPPVSVLEQMGLVSGGSTRGVSVNVSDLDGERIRQTLMELATPRMMYLYRP
jgi:protease-4